MLFPFIRITSPYFPTSPPFPPPLIVATSLPTITRKQLIDALARLSRQTSPPRDSLYIESLISEVVLEYIARKCNAEQEDLVEAVGRKLTEIEFEVSLDFPKNFSGDSAGLTRPQVQMQGDLSIVRSTIHPALQKARFLLGFLSSAQLVVRLNASSHNSIPPSDRVRPDPEQLVRAFITRRLARSIDPTVIVLDLASIQGRLNSASHKSMIISVIESFGLRTDVPAPTEFGASSPTFEPPSPSPTSTSFGPTISPRRATFSRLANKWASRKPIAAAAPKWLSHRKNYSYSAKVGIPGFNSDRRPSLPTLPSLPIPNTFIHTKSPLCGSTTSFHTQPGTASEDSQDWEDVGADSPPLTKDGMLQRLLKLRYVVSKHGGWYLGHSKKEGKALLGQSTFHADDVARLCALFGISSFSPESRAVPEITRASTPPPLDGPSSEPITPPCDPPVAPSLIPLSPADDSGDLLPRELISPLSFAEFDLEENYARIASARSSHAPKLSLTSTTTSIERSSDSHHTYTQGFYKARRRSTGVESLVSDVTHRTGHTHGRGSRMSAFSIRQATKEWPLESKAYMYELAAQFTSSQQDTSDVEGEEPQEILRPAHRHTRSRSETDLLALIDRDSALSPLPPRPSSLRRNRKFDSQLQISLASYKLGEQPLPIASASQLLPDFHFQAASDDANHSHMSIRSLLLSGMGRAPLTPPISPESSVFNTPRPGAFPLPPDGHPFDRKIISLGPSSRAGHSHRQYTVINGEVSPSRLGHSDESDYFDSPLSPSKTVSSPPATDSEKSRTSSSSSRKLRDKALPVPPRTTSLSLRNTDAFLWSTSDTPLSLALSLFEISKLPPPPHATDVQGGETHVIIPKRELTVDDVNIVLGDMVDSEKARIKSRGKKWDDAARCRVGWLMDQVGDLVSAPDRAAKRRDDLAEGWQLNDSRFSPIIDVHLDRLAPASLKNNHLDRLSPASSTSSQRSLPRIKPSSPLVPLSQKSLLLVEEDESPPIPQSSPRPPPRPLARAVSPKLNPLRPSGDLAKPLMVPLSPVGKAPTRPLPTPPRPKMRNVESRDSSGSCRSSKLSIGTFGH